MKEFFENMTYVGNIDVAVVEGRIEDHDMQWILEQMMKFQETLETRNMNVSVTVDITLGS